MRKIIKNKKRLSIPCEDVEFSKGVKISLTLLSTALALGNARGLAHNQIGGTKRVFIARTNGGFNRYINPQLLELSPDTYETLECCFSCTGNVKVKRHHSIKIKYQIKEDEFIEETFVGDDAQVIQHELDHLNGTTINDISI
tara:strand:- start:94 stop:519 length:426 start_codon:yes stop_codon:yes gene_type:complete